MKCFSLSAEYGDLVQSGTLMASKCKTHCRTQGPRTSPLFDTRGRLCNICTACGHAGEDARSGFRWFFTALKQKHRGRDEYFTRSFFPPSCPDSDWQIHHVGLVLHFLPPVPPIMLLIISAPVEWKTDVAVIEGRRQ